MIHYRKQTKKNYNASFEVDTADPLLSFCCLFECFVRSSAGNDGITYNTDSQRIWPYKLFERRIRNIVVHKGLGCDLTVVLILSRRGS